MKIRPLHRTFFRFPKFTATVVDEANAFPRDPRVQAMAMERLAKADPLEAIQRYESGLFSMDRHCTLFYLRALYKTEQFDKLAAFIPKQASRKEDAHRDDDARSAPAGHSREHPLFVHTTDSRKPWSSLGGLANLLLTAGILFVLYKSSAGRIEDLFGKQAHKIYSRDEDGEHVGFDNVRGCDEAKEELLEIVEFLKDPGKFNKLGARLPKGVLLVGPPGTGKTLLAKAVAGEANVPFIYASGSEFDEMFVGLGSMRIRQMFEAAKSKAPAIIFIDEIDAIGSKRNPRDPQHARMSLNQLLVELDGFAGNEGVIVIAATNFAETLDRALLRPGRFDRHVNVPLPDVKGRTDILDLFLAKARTHDDVDISVLARGTPGFSGADLAKLVNQAKINASKQSSSHITMAHLETAKDEMLMGVERRSAVMADEDRRITAYHESGHALVAIATAGAMPIHKATIMPRGRALGMVAQLPERDHLHYTRQQLLARLDVAMGGRVAEELVFGPDAVTTGASSDLLQATAIARSMVTEYGMSDAVGPIALGEDEWSAELQAVVDAEVKRLLEEAKARAVCVLQSRRAPLDRLARALLEHETLTRDQIEHLVK